MIELSRTVAGDLLECCSRSGDFKVSNLTLADQSYLLIWPSGDYKLTFAYFDKIDDNIMNLTMTTVIKH